MKKKVLIVTQNFYPVIGSAGNRMKNIFELLTNHDIETIVLTTEPAYPNETVYQNKAFWNVPLLNEPHEHIVRLPIRKRRFGKRLIGRLFYYLETMVKFFTQLVIWRKHHFDYIYVSSPPIFIVFSVLFGNIFLKSKIILEIRDLWPDSLTGVKQFNFSVVLKLFRFFEKMMYNKAHFIVINSIGFKRHIEHRLNEEIPIIYLPNGLRRAELLHIADYHETFTVVYTGNIGLAQDITRLQRLAQILDKKRIRFVVIGYGVWAERFKRFLDEHQLSHVEVFPPTTREKCLRLIRKCHVAIAILNDEAVFSTVLPGKVIDYIGCQTPVVAGVHGVAAQTIVTNDVGFTFGQDDVTEMIEKIEELKANPTLLNRLRDNCLTTIQRQFIWEDNIHMLLDMLKR